MELQRLMHLENENFVKKVAIVTSFQSVSRREGNFSLRLMTLNDIVVLLIYCCNYCALSRVTGRILRLRIELLQNKGINLDS